MTNIYIIKLEDNKYYIGKTNNLERRKQEHIDGNASAWTNKYKPISIEKIIPNASPFDEDKYTKEYMAKFGIDNVRGGSYVQINLNAAQIESLNREIKGATDACHNCGEIGHYIKYCSKKQFLPTFKDNSKNFILANTKEKTIERTLLTKNNIEYECEYCDRTFTTAFGCGVHEKSCKKNNIEYECEYCDRTFTTAFGCRIHEKSCKEKEIIKNNVCYRCGRDGHYSPDCYATYHIDGTILD